MCLALCPSPSRLWKVSSFWSPSLSCRSSQPKVICQNKLIIIHNIYSSPPQSDLKVTNQNKSIQMGWNPHQYLPTSKWLKDNQKHIILMKFCPPPSPFWYSSSPWGTLWPPSSWLAPPPCDKSTLMMMVMLIMMNVLIPRSKPFPPSWESRCLRNSCTGRPGPCFSVLPWSFQDPDYDHRQMI